MICLVPTRIENSTLSVVTKCPAKEVLLTISIHTAVSMAVQLPYNVYRKLGIS